MIRRPGARSRHLDARQKNIVAALNDIADHAEELFQISCKFKADGQVPPLESNVVNQLTRSPRKR